MKRAQYLLLVNLFIVLEKGLSSSNKKYFPANNHN